MGDAGRYAVGQITGKLQKLAAQLGCKYVTDRPSHINRSARTGTQQQARIRQLLRNFCWCDAQRLLHFCVCCSMCLQPQRLSFDYFVTNAATREYLNR